MSLRHALIALPLLVATPCVVAAPSSPDITQLGWLSGCWQLDDQPAGSGEQWSTLAGGTLLGTSRSLRGDRIASFEFMLLRQQDDGQLVLTALPNGRNPTPFTATHVDADEAVFENPGNDFPQRIRYRRVDDQRALARIDIAQHDPKQAIDFPMHRVRCEPAAPSR